MSSDKENVLLENLNEFIQDEDKIVTYKWLSCQLAIQVNYAKELLKKYIESYADVNLLIIYLIIGNSDGSIRVTIVPESELDSIQSEFDTVLSKHIYSIQKKSIAFNINSLFSVDKTHDSSFLRKIKSKECVIKKSTARVVNIPVENVINNTNNTVKAKDDKQKSPTSISGMFAKQQIKVETNNISEKNESKKTTPNTSLNKISKKEKNKNSSQKGIGNFFSQKTINNKSFSNESNSTETSKVIEIESSDLSITDLIASKDPVKENDINEENINIAVDKDSYKNNNKKESIINIASKENKKSETKKITKSKKKLSKTNGTNKRKRIVLASDSESSEDEIFGDDSPKSPRTFLLSDDDGDDVIPGTPQVSLTARIKKRKIVDKTHLDSEGFMVTDKEVTLASDSEQEEVVEKSQPIVIEKKKEQLKELSTKKDSTEKKNSAKKAKQATLTKQATLMNFFKKN